jgi:UDP-glucose 4-epimerase
LITAMPCVLVTGAGGALGPFVVRALEAGGAQVTAALRSATYSHQAGQASTRVIGDVRDERTLAAGMQPGGVVIHLAGRSGWRRWGLGVNAAGTAAVMRAARQAGAARVVLASSIHVYGATPSGFVADETTRPRPSSAYGASKLASEHVAMKLASSPPGPELVVLRIAAVYGTGRGNLARLEWLLRKPHLLAAVPWGDVRRTLVHVEDVAAAMVAAALRPEAAGEILNVTEGRIRTLREIVTALAAAAGRPVPWLRVSWTAGDLAVDGSRMQGALGYRPGCALRNATRLPSVSAG